MCAVEAPSRERCEPFSTMCCVRGREVGAAWMMDPLVSRYLGILEHVGMQIDLNAPAWACTGPNYL